MADSFTRYNEEARQHGVSFTRYNEEARQHGVEGKPTNPKDRIAVDKLPLHLVPDTAIAAAALAHLDGALKYGTFNWRIAGVRASVYVDAARRHLAAWFNGEDYAPDSGVHHLGHAIACINILIDSQACGKLTDDRAPKVDLKFDAMTESVRALRVKHAGKDPKHYTIADSPQTLTAD